MLCEFALQERCGSQRGECDHGQVAGDEELVQGVRRWDASLTDDHQANVIVMSEIQ